MIALAVQAEHLHRSPSRVRAHERGESRCIARGPSGNAVSRRENEKIPEARGDIPTKSVEGCRAGEAEEPEGSTSRS